MNVKGQTLADIRKETGRTAEQPTRKKIKPKPKILKVEKFKPSIITKTKPIIDPLTGQITGLPIRKKKQFLTEEEEEEEEEKILKPRISEFDIRREPTTGAIRGAELQPLPTPQIEERGRPVETRQVVGGLGREYIVVSQEEIMRRAREGVETFEGSNVFFGGGAVSQPEVFISEVTGRNSGVTLPDGRTFLGLSPEEAISVAQQSAGAKGIISVSEGARQRAIEREQARIVGEEAPVRRELDPREMWGERFPVAGGSVALTNILIQRAKRKDPEKARGYATMGFLAPEDLRTDALTQIEKDVYEKGATASEEFGAFVEAIPVVGGFVSKYVSGLIETPYGNIQEMRKKIKKETTRATNLMTLSRSGEIPPELARQQITDIENELQRLESRIKMLVNFSPQLRFNSDQINTIETEILRSREILLEAKLRASLGATTTPTDYQLAQQLQDLSGISLE